MAETENGYIKLYRSMLDWEWYKDINTCKLFLHLLLSANNKPHKWNGITIERGQLVTSIAKLAEKTGLSERQVRTALNHLISTNSLTSRTTARYRIITVNNYDFFQNPTNWLTNYRQTDDKLPTNYRQQSKNIKNIKNNKNIRSSSRARATQQLPLLTDINSYITEKGLNVDGSVFFEHYNENGWTTASGKPVTNWKQLLRVWDSKELKKKKEQTTAAYDIDLYEKMLNGKD